MGQAIFNYRKEIIINKSYILFLFTGFILSVVFTYYYFLYTHEYPNGSSASIANFEAHKVFQTRLLVPFIASLLTPLVPIITFIFGNIIPYPIDFQVILQILNVLFLFSLIITLPILLNLLGCRCNHWLVLLILIPIGWNYIVINGFVDGAGLYYAYDIPSLSLFNLCLILFLKKKWGIFYPIWLIACLNRESICFVSIGGFLLCFQYCNLIWPDILKANASTLLHVIIQAFTWLIIRILLSYTFKDNPGEFFEQPHSMLEFILKIFTGESHWAMNNPQWFLTLFAGFWIIPFILYKHLNRSSKLLLFLGLIYILVLIFRSNMMESRVYNELNVILFLCSICTFDSYLKNRSFS